MLIAATGLAGAGKTTCLKFLSAMGAGTYLYIGEIVRAELEERGLDPTPESERIVREALRAESGMDALAKRAASKIHEKVAAGHSVLIDAIYNSEEVNFYRDAFGMSLHILAIETPFEVRAERLAKRRSRPMTAEQLRARDSFECQKLSIDTVIAQADLTLSNSGSEVALQAALRTLSPRLCD